MSALPQLGSEREQLAAALRKSTDTYLRCVKNIPESAASTRLSDNSWSIFQIVEHVAVAEHGMYRAIELATEKATPPDYARDAQVVKTGLNRETKLQAPERAVPKGRWKSMADAIEAFEKSRARSLQLVESGEQDLRKIESAHPLMGPLDGYQLVLLMSAHAERHAAQIEEIKSCAAYKAAAES